MKKIEYPRVVILSMTDISSSSATGSLLRELFFQFPCENIFQIIEIFSSDKIAERYKNRFKIPVMKPRIFPLIRLWPIKQILRSLSKYRSNTLKEVSKFKPDIIYVRVVENLYPYLELAELISTVFNIPIVSHTMDDYEARMEYSKKKSVRTVKRNILKRDLEVLFKVAKLNFAVSERMKLNFQEKYGYQFEVFHNGIASEQWVADSKKARDLNDSEQVRPCFKIVMAGSIERDKDAKVISQVSRAVDNLNKSGKLNCCLILNVPKFYLPSASSLAELHVGVTAQEYLPLEDYRQLLMGADCLILARNSDKITRAYTEHSFHNKLPEYMASGTLIFCIGPEWDGSVQFLKENRCAVVISNATDSEIREKVVAMATYPEQFAECLINAKEIAVAEFDIKQIRTRFRQRLCEAAGALTK